MNKNDGTNQNVTNEIGISAILRLLLDKADITINALANRLNFPAPTIHRITIGEVKDPRVSTLITIANYFGITTEQLLGREPLDFQYYSPHVRPPQSIPILTMAEAAQHEKSLAKPQQWLCWKKQTHISTPQSALFGVAIKSNLYEPTFANGMIVITDPIIKPESGDYVLVNFIGDSICTIKKYISEGSNKYLYPIQTEMKAVSLDKNDCRVVGVIIESQFYYK